jgi:predicted TIM-barrel fold metal-dependent hydrolase
MLIIDSHAHIYSEDENKYPVMEKPYRPPRGKGTLTNLRQEMKNAGVRYVAAIQTKTFYHWDNRFVTDAAKANRDWMVGVVTLDPDDPHSLHLLEQYVRHNNVRAFRSIPAKSGRLDDPAVARLWEKCLELGIVVNVLINRDKRDELTALLTRYRKLRVVLDHCLNITVGPDLDKTLADLLRLARQPNLYAKVDQLPIGSAEEYPFKDMHALIRQVIKAYGPDRCTWGSCFPCELWCKREAGSPQRATYAQHLRLFTHELGLDQPTQEAVLGKTALGLWFAGYAP